MGFGVSASHIIFFIAAIVISVAVVGALQGTSSKLTGGIAIRGEHLHDELTTNIRIVNDPGKVKGDPLTLYVLNTGSRTLHTTDIILFIDGQVHTDLAFDVLGGSDAWRPGQTLEIVATGTNLPSGDHRARVVVAHGVSDTLRFNLE